MVGSKIMWLYIQLTACRHETTRRLVTHSEIPTHDSLRHVIFEKRRETSRGEVLT